MPAHVHISIADLSRAGTPCTRTVVAPEIQGAVVTGTQGMGVSTPFAAAVAAATVGFASEVHMAKGVIFAMGAISEMFPINILETMTFRVGRTTKGVGAVPCEQAKIPAPPTTAKLTRPPGER